MMRLSSILLLLQGGLILSSPALSIESAPHPTLHVVWCYCGVRPHIVPLVRGSILSFLLQSSPSQPLRIHIFTDVQSFGPLYSFMQEVQQSTTSCLQHASWRVYDISGSKHDLIAESSYRQPELNTCSGLRFFAFNSSQLEEDILAWNQKSGGHDQNALVLYVDTDTLALTPLQQIQQGVMDLLRPPHPKSKTDGSDGWPLFAAADHCEYTNMGATNRIPHPLKNGLQAGVIAADITRWRSEGVLDEILALQDEYEGRLDYGDQDLLNIWAARNKGMWAEMPLRFNTWNFDCYVDRPAMIPNILHGAGGRFWRPYDQVGRDMTSIWEKISSISRICLDPERGQVRQWKISLDGRESKIRPALWRQERKGRRAKKTEL
jgi:hypothetical protein